MAAVPSSVPGSSPIPLASGDYASAAATANTAYQNALASINGQRQQALQSFGYTGTIDPSTGQITNMAVDPNNPYGQYQQLLSQGNADQQGVQAADASRGIGATTGARGGGLAAQGLTAAKLNFGGQSAALGENLMNTLSGLTSQQQDAQDTENNALWQAELASAQGAISGQMFDPANMSGITDQPGPGGSVPAPVTSLTPNVGKAAKEPRVGYDGGPPPKIRATKGTKSNTFTAAAQNKNKPKKK